MIETLPKTHDSQAVKQASLLHLRLHSVSYLAQQTSLFEFRAVTGENLPPFTAGAHLDLHLPGGLLRSYSLIGDPNLRDRYLVAIKEEPDGRGGSRLLHADFKVGQTLDVGVPRNNFPLDETADHSVLFAGGIGISPIFSMIRRLQKIGKSWELHYATRSRDYAVYLDQLSQYGAAVHLYFDDEVEDATGAPALDIAVALGGVPANAQIYCCGPLAMLNAFEQATSDIAPENIHTEYFSSDIEAATDGGIEVVLQATGKTVLVEEGQTILEALLELGMDLPFSCMEGTCGSCETVVLEGVPDHRDHSLTKKEKIENKKIMICCSGSLTPKIVLDL